MSQVIYFKQTDEIFHKFANYEIWPCVIVENNNSSEPIYEICNSDDVNIAIWCVYGHFFTGGLECISDHGTLEEAEEFERTLPILKQQR